MAERGGFSVHLSKIWQERMEPGVRKLWQASLLALFIILCITTAALGDDSYTRSAGRYYTIVHQVVVENPGTEPITDLRVEVPLACMASTSWQDFIGEELLPKPAQIITGQHGCRTAVYQIGKLLPGEKRTLVQRFAVQNFAVEFHLNAADITWNYQDINPSYLTPEPGIESDSETIISYAESSVEYENNPYSMARRIFGDIGRYLEYQEDTDVVPSAVTTLQNGFGNCENYTYLFVACMRALGIPARWHSGYLYLPQEQTVSPYINENGSLNGDEMRHVWAEVYLPEVGWVIVDPTYSYTVEIGDTVQKIIDWEKFANISSYERHIWLSEGSDAVNDISYSATTKSTSPKISFQAEILPLLDICPYKDLPGHWAKESAMALATMSDPIMTGFSSTYFGVMEPLTRSQLVAIINRTFDYTDDGAVTTFPDVPQKHWAAHEIAIAQSKGYIEGYPDGTFRPDAVVTRGELAAILTRVAQLPAGGQTPFTDLLQNGWAWCAGAVQSLYAAGLTSGYTETTFAPQNVVTRGECAVFIYRFLQSAYYER